MNLLVKKTLLLVVFLLAAFLRFYRLDAQSFWNDEGNSARIAERSVQLIVEGAAGDIHPPGYYLLLAAWRAAAGHSEFALRGLSAFAGIILIALVYRLGKQYFDEPAALCAAFFAAIHPALIYYSQEARMYEWVATLAAGCWLLADSEWPMANGSGQMADGRWRPRFVIRHLSSAIFFAAGLYTHYSFAFIVIAVNLYFAVRLAHLAITNYQFLTTNLKSLLSNLFLLQLLALLLFSPWLPISIRQVTTWPAGREYSPFLSSLFRVASWLTFGSTIDAEAGIVSVIIGAMFLAIPLAWRRGTLLAPLIWLLVPTGLTLGSGLFSQTFAKFLIIAVPALCLVLGNGLAAVVAPTVGAKPSFSFVKMYIRISRDVGNHISRIAFIFGVFIGIVNWTTLRHLYFDPAYARADYRGIVRYIDSIAKPGDAILLNAPNQWEVVTYYHTDTSNVFPVARTRPLDAPAQIAELESIAATHDRLFVIYWGDAQSDPERVIESWLNEHTFKAYDQWYGDVRLAAYAVPRTATTLETRADVTFGDRIILDGYSLNAQTFSPGDILQLTLFWRALSPISNRYKVFVHLIGDPSQPPVAQHDGEPGGGLALTTTWQPGQTVADNHGVFIPLDLPPGEYSLVIGLYGVDDATRLTHPGGDALFLSTITVR